MSCGNAINDIAGPVFSIASIFSSSFSFFFRLSSCLISSFVFFFEDIREVGFLSAKCHDLNVRKYTLEKSQKKCAGAQLSSKKRDNEDEGFVVSSKPIKTKTFTLHSKMFAKQENKGMARTKDSIWYR